MIIREELIVHAEESVSAKESPKCTPVSRAEFTCRSELASQILILLFTEEETVTTDLHSLDDSKTDGRLTHDTGGAAVIED